MFLCGFGWQHVLEHGRDHERKEIITKLAGQIVQMSQHKFASNVVEKCLEFGGPAERQILIDEMLGLTDENEPLQVGFIHIIYEVDHKITMDILGHPLQRTLIITDLNCPAANIHLLCAEYIYRSGFFQEEMQKYKIVLTGC